MDGLLAGPDPVLLGNPVAIAALEELELPELGELVVIPGSGEADLSLWGVDSGLLEVFGQVGIRTTLWDELFFEVIHVIPRVKDVGSVVSPTVFEVEVWAANYWSHYCAGLTVTGPSGVSVAGGLPLPAWWAPFGSVFFEVTVSPIGDPRIDNLLIWDFPGYPGADCHVLGLRVVLWIGLPNGDFEEAFGYATDVQASRNGTEQRRGLRGKPTRELRFKSTLTPARVIATLQARLEAIGRNAFSVPFWPDAADLEVPLEIGEDEIMVETAGRSFEAGRTCMLWLDPQTWESFTIDEVLSDRLVLSSSATRRWSTVGTKVVPLFPGRFTQDPRVLSDNGDLAEIDASFSVEAV